MATPNGMTTQQLDEALHAHFIREEDRTDAAGAGAVYLTEVTAPGHSGRRADAVHIGLWSSRGAGRIDVCELKVSRADWLRELAKPQKAEAWWHYCNAFWLVVPTADIVKDGELPHGWGLMAPGGRGRRFKVLAKPQEREAELTVGLLLTLLKNTETTRVNALRQQERELWEKFRKQEEFSRRERSVISTEGRRKLDMLERLETALGTEISRYDWQDGLTPEGAADCLRDLVKGRVAVDGARHRAESAARDLDRVAKEATAAAQLLRKELGI